MIAWLASYPRSGNTLFRETLFDAFGVRSGSVYGEVPGRNVARSAVDPRPPAVLKQLDKRVLVKTHETREATTDEPAIYLVRDGRDAIVSYAHFAIATEARGVGSRNFEEAVRDLIKGTLGVGAWSDHVDRWTRRGAPITVIRFEDLIGDPAVVVREALSALGISLPQPIGMAPTFAARHARNPTMFRRGYAGVWKAEMPAGLEQIFWDLHGAEMEALGYDRDHGAGP